MSKVRLSRQGYRNGHYVTNPADSPVHPGQTVETVTVSNDDFLRALFASFDGETRPVLVSFLGDPRATTGRHWAGRPWRRGEAPPPDNNNYFSLATFHPDAEGRLHRKKSQFAALYAVMLDDIGSKVLSCDRLPLTPTWSIETSPQNYQVGYLLSEPLRDGKAADRLMKAIVAAGLCDPGANGPRTRLARLPVAINGKHSPPFRCRISTWAPDLRYSEEELVHGLQLDLAQPRRLKRSPNRSVGPRPDGYDPVWRQRPAQNPVLAALRGRDLYKAPLGEGKHHISCPWVEQHTDGIDGGTAYFEPDDTWPIGGFKCLHGHCAERHIRDLLTVLNIEVDAARMTAVIRVVAGELHRVVDAAESELAAAGRYYQRGGLIVTVTTDPGTKATRIQELSQPALTRSLAAAATWERYDLRAQSWVRRDPPARHVSVLSDSISYAHLPVLHGLARQPYLRPDGSLMQQPGYDADTGIFGVFDARRYSIPQRPTRSDAEAALAVLEDLLSEFSFADASDTAAALAAILTATVRSSLPAAPMFHIKAPTIGSGKSYLCELITAFATPQPNSPTPLPSDDEECRKLLLAELLHAPAVVEFDNLTRDLTARRSLCIALTAEHMTGRILGVSKTATVSTRTLFLSSGNNVDPVQDMARRCVTINLSPQCETPAAHQYKRPNLVPDVLHERERYVAAALTIIRAWITAGQPKAECRPLASYGKWSDLCRQPLLWLGRAEPTESVFEAIVDDPDRETLSRLLHAWLAVFGKTPTRVRDAVGCCSGLGDMEAELNEVFQDIAGERGEINRHRLGKWLRRHAGRIVDGMQMVSASGNPSATYWRVEVVKTVSPVSAVSIL